MPDQGVSWEMVCRFRNDDIWIELHALDTTEIEVVVQSTNAPRRSMSATFAEVRQALDELERSAREIERL